VVASAYFAGLSSAFVAQSSQQTVISLPPTLTLIPPSLMSQSQTGHFFVFIKISFNLSLSLAAFCTSGAAVSDEEIVARLEKSDFQILAHFAQAAVAGISAHVGGRAAKLAPESVRKVAVAGKAEFEGKQGQIIRAIGQSFQRSAQSQTGQVTMHGNAGSLLKDTCQMEWRCVHGTSDIVERDAFTHPARKISFSGLNAVCVIRIRAVASGLM
jgi:hypothetical protein